MATQFKGIAFEPARSMEKLVEELARRGGQVGRLSRGGDREITALFFSPQGRSRGSLNGHRAGRPATGHPSTGLRARSAPAAALPGRSPGAPRWRAAFPGRLGRSEAPCAGAASARAKATALGAGVWRKYHQSASNASSRTTPTMMSSQRGCDGGRRGCAGSVGQRQVIDVSHPAVYTCARVTAAIRMRCRSVWTESHMLHSVQGTKFKE